MSPKKIQMFPPNECRKSQNVQPETRHSQNFSKKYLETTEEHQLQKVRQTLHYLLIGREPATSVSAALLSSMRSHCETLCKLQPSFWFISTSPRVLSHPQACHCCVWKGLLFCLRNLPSQGWWFWRSSLISAAGPKTLLSFYLTFLFLWGIHFFLFDGNWIWYCIVGYMGFWQRPAILSVWAHNQRDPIK